MAQQIEFDGTVHEFPDDFTPNDISAALAQIGAPAAPAPGKLQSPAPPIAGANGQTPWWEQDAPSSAPYGTGRALQVGAQGSGAGLADVAGMPVDIATAVMNLLPAAAETGANIFLPKDKEISLGRIRNPVGGSQSINNAASSVAETAGAHLIDEKDMSPQEKLAYNVNRMGTQAIATAGAGQAVNGAAKAGTALQRYTEPFANQTAGNLAVETTSGIGAGAGVTAAHEMFPDSPIADFVASLLGGLTGGRAGQMAAAPKAATKAVVDRVRNDPNIPADPETGQATSRATSNRAREYVQNEYIDPQGAAERVRDQAQSFRDEDLPVPPVGSLSGDVGGIGLERSARLNDPKPFIEKDRQVRQAAADEVGSLDPGPDVNARQATDFVAKQADEQRAAAQAPLDAARNDLSATREQAGKKVADAETAREAELAQRDQQIGKGRSAIGAANEAERAIGGTVAGRAGGEVAASERVAGAVDTAKQADEAKKAGLYREAEQAGRNTPVDPTPLAEDARAIRDEISPLAQQDASLNNVLRDLDRLAPAEKAPTATETAAMIDTGVPTTASRPPADISATDLIAMRPRLSAARDSATRLKRGDVVERIDRINDGISGQLNALAEAGDDAALKWRAAEENFKGDFAPKYREGVGAQLDRNERANQPTPATAVAGKFIKPGAGGKEAAEDLKRILKGSEAEGEGLAGARDYVLADMSKTVGADGKINPQRLRTWIKNREGVFQSMPELRAEAEQTLRDVVNGRAATTKLQQDLDRMVADRRGAGVTLQKQIDGIKADAKLTEKQKTSQIAELERKAADVERGIQTSATSLLLDTDPVKAVRGVFSSKDPQMAMREIVGKLKGDKDAMAGWKKAVSGYLDETLTTTNTALTSEGTQPVSPAALTRLFQKNEKVLSEIYDAKEMNALRRAQKLLEPGQSMTLQVTPGSPTTENSNRLMRYLEIGLKTMFGGLEGGNKFRNVRLALQTIPGLNETAKIQRLVTRMQLDPDLAVHLLETPTTQNKLPDYNKRLNRLLATGEAVRESNDDDR